MSDASVPPPPSAAAAGPELSVKAVLSLVIGIIGLFTCPLLGAVIAVVLGNQARTEIDQSGGRLTGRGLASAGLIIGWIGLLLFLILLVMAIIAG